MENKDDWHLIEKVGKLKPLASGSDSTVFSLTPVDSAETSSVVKLYENRNFNYIDPKDQTRVLQEYYRDTQKAIGILKQNPNPLEQSIILNGVNFSLEYKIIPQGAVVIEEAKNDYKYSGVETSKASFGQKFVDGLNLRFLDDVPREKELDEKQGIFANSHSLNMEINEVAEDFFAYLSTLLNVKFGCAEINIKPFLDKENRKIILIITDLAASLKEYYEKSPKFNTTENQRQGLE